jgi:hypothetical protein
VTTRRERPNWWTSIRKLDCQLRPRPYCEFRKSSLGLPANKSWDYLLVRRGFMPKTLATRHFRKHPVENLLLGHRSLDFFQGSDLKKSLETTAPKVCFKAINTSNGHLVNYYAPILLEHVIWFSKTNLINQEFRSKLREMSEIVTGWCICLSFCSSLTSDSSQTFLTLQYFRDTH